MSESYEIQGVKITPAAGGYYDLTHSSLDEPERVRGKEKADQRAVEIAKAAETPDGSIPPQGMLQSGQGGDVILPGDTRSPAERAQETAAANRGDENLDPTQKPADDGKSNAQIKAEKARETSEVMLGTLDNTKRDTGPEPTGDEKDQKIAALEAQVNGFNDRFDQLLKALQPAVRTVETIAAENEQPGMIPPTLSTSFTGPMSDENKKALKKAGLDYTTIVLEEGESIPPTGLFISHNGRAYVIKPGEEVDVPDFLLGVLDDAVMSAPIADSKTQKVLGYRNRSKYPYRKV